MAGNQGNGRTRAKAGADRKAEIIEAAANIFMEKGYEAASIQDVADAVDILKGSLYYYIKSKDDLLYEVIQEVHHRFPGLPVIMITSHGNEDIALQALQQGAASYIPKRSLNARLLESTRTVLSVSSRERDFAEAAQFIDSQKTVLRLPNDRSVVSGVVAWMQEQATQRGIVESTDAVRLGVALEEALMNAIIHGNLEVSSDLRQQGGDSVYNEFIELHSVQEPFCDRRVVVSAELESERARFEIRDEGPGFDISSIPDPTDPENLLRPSGRGLLLMQAFVDDVEFNTKGNCVTLTCRRTSEGMETREISEPGLRKPAGSARV